MLAGSYYDRLSPRHTINRDQPQTLDYIRLKHEVGELQKQAADWQRRIEVAQLQSSKSRSQKQPQRTGP